MVILTRQSNKTKLSTVFGAARNSIKLYTGQIPEQKQDSISHISYFRSVLLNLETSKQFPIAVLILSI